MNYTVEDATHRLQCSHVVGRNRINYTMPCLILKEMGDGRVKIMVFGDRNWKGKDDKKRIRYISKDRLA